MAGLSLARLRTCAVNGAATGVAALPVTTALTLVGRSAYPWGALSQVPTEELLLELRRRIIAPRDRRHETWDDWGGGVDPHGDWPNEG